MKIPGKLELPLEFIDFAQQNLFQFILEQKKTNEQNSNIIFFFFSLFLCVSRPCRGLPFSYDSGWKDWCCVFFYTLICIIMHALLQEYLIEVNISHLYIY